MTVYALYRAAHSMHKRRIPFFPRFLTLVIRLFFGCYVPYTAAIGERTLIAYEGIGVVIHARSIIGTNCYIGPGVVIGGTSKNYQVPKVGNRVFIGAGAKILG